TSLGSVARTFAGMAIAGCAGVVLAVEPVSACVCVWVCVSPPSRCDAALDCATAPLALATALPKASVGFAVAVAAGGAAGGPVEADWGGSAVTHAARNTTAPTGGMRRGGGIWPTTRGSAPRRAALAGWGLGRRRRTGQADAQLGQLALVDRGRSAG